LTGKNVSIDIDTQVRAQSDGFPAFCEQVIESQRGLPFLRAEIVSDWKGRGNMCRGFTNSVTNFAMQAFWLDEQLEEANQALRDLCDYYLTHPGDLHESRSFHWAGATLSRLWCFFGPGGSRATDRIDALTQSRMLEMFWTWSSVVSPILDPDASHIWRVPNTENHHAMGAVTAWALSKFLSESTDYADRTYTDGRSAREHQVAWEGFLKTYFRSRAGKGQCIEIACATYNGPTLHMWYSLVDFAEDPVLRRLARMFLDLFWMSWAEDQIDGVRGGGKTRVYQRDSRKHNTGGLTKMAELYFGKQDEDRLSIGQWVVATSRYRLPDIVYRLALDTEGRGSYEVSQRCMGLWEEGWVREISLPVLPFGVAGLRDDFGGILRYSYCTPEFVIGTLMTEALPHDRWSRSATQNRWQGVVFRGHPDARIVPECRSVSREDARSDTYNQHWSVQKEGALIVQKLDDRFSEYADESRVWFSRSGLSEPTEQDGWVLVESDGAYAGVRVVYGGFAWDDPEGYQQGRWLRCLDSVSPIVIEVGLKRDYADLGTFGVKLAERQCEMAGDVLTYESLAGHRLTLHAGYASVPEIDGDPVDYAPERVYDSPHIRSDWDSGLVRLQYGSDRVDLDFNDWTSRDD
jgi:hypothetical protein